jgi:centractin
MTGGLETDLFLGSQAEEYRGLLNIRYPMEHGLVKDWNDMEKVWQHIYSKNQLNCNSEEVCFERIRLVFTLADQQQFI